jgi:D-glycero-D-manno-heptose 1,7-bisphosphate phosphatase
MARIPQNQAVFFELDGVLVPEIALQQDGAITYYSGALAALARLDPRQFRLFVATNRTDIAFGQLRERDFKKFCERLIADCAQVGLEIAKIYGCPYHPKGKSRFRKDSVFRKPAPGMFKIAQQEFDLNLARCWMIGHTTIDMLAASRAGLGTVLVRTGEGGRDGAFHVEPHFVENDIRSAVARINSFEYALKY